MIDFSHRNSSGLFIILSDEPQLVDNDLYNETAADY